MVEIFYLDLTIWFAAYPLEREVRAQRIYGRAIPVNSDLYVDHLDNEGAIERHLQFRLINGNRVVKIAKMSGRRYFCCVLGSSPDASKNSLYRGWGAEHVISFEAQSPHFGVEGKFGEKVPARVSSSLDLGSKL
ncbi:hypothetical protein TNCV_3419961 [Trichonephila clavipes]|nr:hypothetical protein TNCV_3419961 [Trichonephila clavipes]